MAIIGNIPYFQTNPIPEPGAILEWFLLLTMMNQALGEQASVVIKFTQSNKKGDGTFLESVFTSKWLVLLDVHPPKKIWYVRWSLIHDP